MPPGMNSNVVNIVYNTIFFSGNLTEDGDYEDPQNVGIAEEEEDWSEPAFLSAAIGILISVILVASLCVVLVVVSNWRLKNYSNIHTNNNSSLQSSLKRLYLRESATNDNKFVNSNG